MNDAGRSFSLKLATVLLCLSLVAGFSAAFSFSTLLGGGDSEAVELTKSQAEEADFKAKASRVEDGNDGFLSVLFSVVQNDDDEGIQPGEYLTFESEIYVSNYDSICSSGDDRYSVDVWLEGPNVDRSGTEGTYYIYCDTVSVEDVSLDFNAPSGDTGSYTYSVMIGGDSWSEELETDTINTEIKDITAVLDYDNTNPIEGDTVTFDGGYSDGQGGIQTYEWFVDKEKKDTGETFFYTFEEPGDYVVNLRVSDYSWRDDLLGERRYAHDQVQISVDADSDGDGIPDDEDDCPNEEGQEEYDGCPPPPDDDGDGIPNKDDRCPDTPGPEEFDGCPDNDGDGVPDIDDECDNTAGNNPNGCPDVYINDNGICTEVNLGDVSNQQTYSSKSSCEDALNLAPYFQDISHQPEFPSTIQRVDFEIFAADPEGDSINYRTEWNGNTYEGREFSINFSTTGIKVLNVRISDQDDTVTKNYEVEVVQSISDPRDGPPTLRGDGQSCPLFSNQFVISEDFTNGDDITITELEPEPDYFCSKHPIIETVPEGKRTGLLVTPYKDLVDGKTVTVPEDRTWRLHWIATVNQNNTEFICEEGSYNKDEGKCVATPGIVHVCNQDSVWDPARGQCVTHPEVTTVCEKGRFNSQLGQCVFKPDVKVECDRGVYNPNKEACVYEAPVEGECEKGIYNPNTNECVYNPDDTEYLCEGDGTYDPSRGACVTTVQGETVVQCPAGSTLGESGETCYQEANVTKKCPEGFDGTIEDGECVYEADIKAEPEGPGFFTSLGVLWNQFWSAIFGIF